MAPINRKAVGTAHLGIIVDELETLYRELAGEGIVFVSPPVYRKVEYPWAQAACYLQDPDGNWLEFIERGPVPQGSTAG